MKRKYFFIVLIILLMLNLQNVLAIGITPGRTTINFEPGLQKEISFSIINSAHKDMSVVFVVRGNLSEVVTLQQTYAEISSSEDSKSFTYSINLPQRIATPGVHEVEIVAMEMPKNIKEKGAFVGATVAVVTQLHVLVPYPNKYAEAEINIMASGAKTVFLIPVVNRGKLDIVNAKATIDIYTKLNEKIATIESSTEAINSLERKDLVAEWDGGALPGKYLAVATIIYDNEVLTIEKEFNVGEMFLEVQEITVRDFQLGEIAKFNALVENKWATDLEDVYLGIIVYNNEGEIMADFESPHYKIKALSKSEMVAYWDTGGVKKGTYDGKLILNYEEKITERNIQMKITDDNIEVIGLTGHVVVSSKGKFNLNNILIILVIILVVANIFWFFVIKRLMKKK